METYVIVMFILYVLTSGMYLYEMAFKDYSKPIYKSWGWSFFNLLVTTSFAIWTGVLVF